MSPLQQSMLAALHLSSKGERTQEASVREVRLLAQFYPKSPDRISAQRYRLPTQEYLCVLSSRAAIPYKTRWLACEASLNPGWK